MEKFHNLLPNDAELDHIGPLAIQFGLAAEPLLVLLLIAWDVCILHIVILSPLRRTQPLGWAECQALTTLCWPETASDVVDVGGTIQGPGNAMGFEVPKFKVVARCSTRTFAKLFGELGHECQFLRCPRDCYHWLSSESRLNTYRASLGAHGSQNGHDAPKLSVETIEYASDQERGACCHQPQPWDDSTDKLSMRLCCPHWSAKLQADLDSLCCASLISEKGPAFTLSRGSIEQKTQEVVSMLHQRTYTSWFNMQSVMALLLFATLPQKCVLMGKFRD